MAFKPAIKKLDYYLSDSESDPRYVNVSGDTMTGSLTLNAAASTTAGSGTSQISISPATSVNGTSLLYFNIDRAWGFTQDNTGAGTALGLRLYSSDKYFDVYTNGSSVKTLSVYSSNGGESQNVVGIGSQATPGAGALQFGSTSTGAAFYNTADRTTNYERVVSRFTSNNYYLGFEWGGTGTARTLNIGIGAIAGNVMGGNGRYFTLTAGAPFFKFSTGGTGINGNMVDLSGITLQASSLNQTALSVNPTINQNTTAGYTAFAIAVTETATGSGTKKLIDVTVGATNYFNLTNTGTAFFNGIIQNNRNSGTPSTAAGLQFSLNGADANPRFFAALSGQLEWGDGTAARDTNLYRSGANNLKTDDAFETASTLYSQGALTVGTGSASTNATVRGSSFNGLTVDIYSDTASAYNFFRRARGTIGSPTYTTNNSFLGSFGFRGHDGSAFINQDAARISGFATEDFNAGTHSGSIAFYTAAPGTSTAVGSSERFRIDSSGKVRIGSSATISSALTFDAATTAAGGILFGSDANLYRSATDTLKTDDNLIVAAAGTAANSVATIDATQTLTNKRITPRTGSTTSSATPTINTDLYDEYDITALAADITSMTTNLSGSPVNGEELILRFKDNGTARAITWGTSFTSSGMATLLATTVISKTHYVKLRYDSTAAKWVCLAVDSVGY